MRGCEDCLRTVPAAEIIANHGLCDTCFDEDDYWLDEAYYDYEGDE